MGKLHGATAIRRNDREPTGQWRVRLAAATPWALLACALVLLGGLVIYLPRALSAYPINHVQVEGVITAGRQQQLETHISGLVAGKNFFDVPLAQLRAAAASLDWVESAEVVRYWPDRLVVTIRERVPVAVWNDAKLISNQGVLFEAMDKYDTSHLPRLSGNEHDMAQVMTYYHSISQALMGMGVSVERLEVDPRLTARLTLDNGALIVVDREDFAFKLRRFVELYSKVLLRTGHDVKRADLRYADGVAVEFQDKPGITLKVPDSAARQA